MKLSGAETVAEVCESFPMGVGLKSELIVLPPDSSFVEKGEYLVVKTPSQPNFYWGNFLVLRTPPPRGSLVRYLEAHRREFCDSPGIRHAAITWGGSGDDMEADAARHGCSLTHQTVLIASRIVRPPKFNTTVTVQRILPGSEAWNAIWAERVERMLRQGVDLSSAQDFAGDRARFLAQRIGEARGAWWGAFIGDRLAGHMGILWDDKLKIGRAQDVTAFEPYENQGVARTLTFESFSDLRRGGQDLNHLVIVAETDSPASRAYRSVGFVPSGNIFSLERTDCDAPAQEN